MEIVPSAIETALQCLHWYFKPSYSVHFTFILARVYLLLMASLFNIQCLLQKPSFSIVELTLGTSDD